MDKESIPSFNPDSTQFIQRGPKCGLVLVSTLHLGPDEIYGKSKVLLSIGKWINKLVSLS